MQLFYKKSKFSKKSKGILIGITIGLIIGFSIAIVIEFYFRYSPSPFLERRLPELSSIKKNEKQEKKFDPNSMLQGKIVDRIITLDEIPELKKDDIQGKSELLPPPKIIEMISPSLDTTEKGIFTEKGIIPIQQNQQKKLPIIEKKDDKIISSHPSKSEFKTLFTSDNKISMKQSNSDVSYILQVGAYKTEADAEQQRVCLGFQGFESKLSKLDISGIIYYRVHIGPFLKLDEMNSIRNKLLKLGFDATILRISDK
ncbi:MAG: SPOR domain-containing protein [Burkholderia sp.]|nr:SPOR domain-containing protein [Burkholderia sp.]